MAGRFLTLVTIMYHFYGQKIISYLQVRAIMIVCMLKRYMHLSNFYYHPKFNPFPPQDFQKNLKVMQHKKFGRGVKLKIVRQPKLTSLIQLT